MSPSARRAVAAVWTGWLMAFACLLQGPLLFMVCLPAQLGIWRGGDANALALVGALIALIGIGWVYNRFLIARPKASVADA